MRYTLLALALGVAACPKPTPTPDGPVPPVPPLDHPATCADVCRRADELRCPSAQPTAKGATCTKVCESVQMDGIIVWDLPCRATARSCDEADTCEDRARQPPRP